MGSDSGTANEAGHCSRLNRGLNEVFVKYGGECGHGGSPDHAEEVAVELSRREMLEVDEGGLVASTNEALDREMMYL